MINQEQINKIKKEINKSCDNCIHLSRESYDYEGGYTEPAYCTKRDGIENLKSFPFKKEQKCFYIDFHLIDCLDEDLQKLSDKWWGNNDSKSLDKLSKLRDKRYGDLMS